jgi:phage-related tail fiber protein
MQCNTPVASEVLNVVLAANIAPDRQDDTQLLQAINTLIANGGSGGNGGGSGAEIGSVTAFAMPTPPEGWLVCDGSAVSRTDYADLYAAIGTVWGEGDEITTFNLPDLRGEFIRGFDAGRGVDADRVFSSWQKPSIAGFDTGVEAVWSVATTSTTPESVESLGYDHYDATDYPEGRVNGADGGAFDPLPGKAGNQGYSGAVRPRRFTRWRLRSDI